MRSRDEWIGLAERLAWVAAAVIALAFVGRLIFSNGSDDELLSPDSAWPAADGLPVIADSAKSVVIADSLFGLSGALRFRALTAAEALAVPGFVERYGERAIHTPGVIEVPTRGGNFALLVMRPFGAKRGESLNGYRLGRWPAERWLMARNYFNPDGFVEVTPANERLQLSQHFVLGDFLTHDQMTKWPKYVVLEEKLIDKLELVMQALNRAGVRATGAVVLSGFRAPYYNDRGVGEGMARASRHQYGDAADVIIDSNGDRRMDDLSGDGTVDLRDTEVVNRAVNEVEARYPMLAGGLGRYHAMGPRGPFAHIDVRGTSARWENRGRRSEVTGQRSK
ncbi:MAG TPA: hypothetical protein VJ717_11220 [Gemmatimonadaceae bacterium]|nr:hypothetical protein [Gemmatimonadaceae bacterium]